MRAMARWMLVTVFALDAAFAVLFFSGGLPTIGAEPEGTLQVAADSEPSRWTRESLEFLGHRLEQRAADLERREAEVDELLRGSEVLRQAGLAPADGGQEEQEAAETRPAPSPADSPAFERLKRAYENMEPESAAQALAELAARDKEAVVELLLGWKPRTSGAILDALTQNNPALAADVSYEIWRRSGKEALEVATSGR